MNRYLALGIIPLAVACNKNKPAVGTAENQTTQRLAATNISNVPSTFKNILGVLEYYEKCPKPASTADCLKIVGGESFNDTQVFYLPAGQGFEIVKSKEGKVDNVIVQTEHSEAPFKVQPNQHVSLLAKLDSPGPDGSQVIKDIEHLEPVYK